jgi:hypothetical protein
MDILVGEVRNFIDTLKYCVIDIIILTHDRFIKNGNNVSLPRSIGHVDSLRCLSISM